MLFSKVFAACSIKRIEEILCRYNAARSEYHKIADLNQNAKKNQPIFPYRNYNSDRENSQPVICMALAASNGIRLPTPDQPACTSHNPSRKILFTGISQGPIRVAERSEVRVWGRLLARTAGLNHAGDTDDCLL
jgi:hypothetical protein